NGGTLDESRVLSGSSQIDLPQGNRYLPDLIVLSESIKIEDIQHESLSSDLVEWNLEGEAFVEDRIERLALHLK
ncbi:hypothetical protein PMAYCL1PPCAC_28611, partial [Pristionchus mayeri]